MNTVTDALSEAVRHHEAARFPEAERLYLQILQTDPSHADAIHLLGVLDYQRGQYESAITRICRAIELQPSCPAYHNNLGLAYRGAHRYHEARAAHEHALRLDPGYAAAHANLGWVHQQLSQLADAQLCYQRAIDCRPAFAAAHHGLGMVLQEQGQLEPALARHSEAVRLQPGFAEAHYHLGEVQHDLGRLSEALVSYQVAVRRRPDHAEANHCVGQLLEDLGRSGDARVWWARPHGGVASDAARIQTLMTTPVIFQSAEHMRRQRQRMLEGLAILAQESLSIADPLVEVNTTNFYAAYHGLNDRDLQTRLARLFERSTPSLNFVAPHCRQPLGANSGLPLRIGFVSRFFHTHTIGEVTVGILRELSRKLCQVILLPLAGPDDDIARLIRASADRVVPLPSVLDAACNIIAEQRLDVLFYTDIGMDPFTYFLAFARLAPVQCVTWGHPVTTGIPTIDYYLSSADQEPLDADAHYSEQLVLLPGLPTFYIAPAVLPPLRTRASFGLDQNTHYYLCTQAPFKVHPDFDAILREILRADPQGRVLFVRGHTPSWTHELIRRLRRTMPAEFGRIQFLPHQRGQDYLKLLALCDALLDTTCFSGGNTALKAFSVGAPIVTLPGDFARGRTTFACYRKMGVMDCVASDPADYVRIAVRLGTDQAWRQSVCARIKSAQHVLYEDASVVRAMEAFFVEAVGRSGKPSYTR